MAESVDYLRDVVLVITSWVGGSAGCGSQTRLDQSLNCHSLGRRWFIEPSKQEQEIHIVYARNLSSLDGIDQSLVITQGQGRKYEFTSCKLVEGIEPVEE